MFDQILQMVKENIGGNPQVAAAIPPEKQDAVHREIAEQVSNGLGGQLSSAGGIGGMLSALQTGGASGNPISGAIGGNLAKTLANKFGLPPAAINAIVAALPGLLQKFAQKANDPNDKSVTPDSITGSLSGLAGGLGGLFGKK